MAIQNEPTRIQIPFADSGTKNVIPDTNSTPSASQAASWTDGFPAQCSLPLSAGGIPPARADFNGLFNTMSQSIRYGQEGGIWAWDATVDYGANRVVLGSDGLLYWSVAQSGPNVGGAQDPTTDTAHVYWSTMPMLTPPLADDSNKAATTEWVNDLALATIYVSPTGDDSNNGFSAATAVKTIQKAIDISKKLIHGNSIDARIEIDSGSYSGNITIVHTRVVATLKGNVSITGNITIYNQSYLRIEGSNYTLTTTGSVSVTSASYMTTAVSSWIHNGVFIVTTNSVLSTPCLLTISSSSGVALQVNKDAVVVFSEAVSITVSGTAHAIDSIHGARVLFLKAVTINAQNCSEAIVRNSFGSVLYCAVGCSITGSGNSSGVEIIQGSVAHFLGLTVGDCLGSSGIGLYITSNSFVLLQSTCSLYSGASGNCVLVQQCGVLQYTGSSSALTLTVKSSSATALTAAYCGVIRHTSGTISVKAPNGGHDAFYINENSVLNIANLSASNNWTCLFNVSLGGVVYSYSDATITNNATGKRYNVSSGGIIYTGGLGANRLPGSTAGTVESSSYAYYY